MIPSYKESALTIAESNLAAWMNSSFDRSPFPSLNFIIKTFKMCVRSYRIHKREDLFDSLLGRVFFQILDRVFSKHWAHGSHYLKHFFLCYRSVSVNIVKFERPYGSALKFWLYLKALHSSFCSIEPREVIEIALKNSVNSIEPSPFSSKFLKRNLEKSVGSPFGKNWQYIFVNSNWLIAPPGLSVWKHSCQSMISLRETENFQSWNIH